MASKRAEYPEKRSVRDQQAFAFYKKNSKYREVKNTDHLTTYGKIIGAFYKKIADKMLEKPGGVFIPGFGYFVILLNPIKKVVDSVYETGQSFLINPHSNSMTYHPALLSTCVDASMKPFVMDKHFNKGFKKELSLKIKSGMRFRNHYGLLLSIFKNKKR